MNVIMNNYKQVSGLIRPLLQYKNNSFKCSQATLKSHCESTEPQINRKLFTISNIPIECQFKTSVNFSCFAQNHGKMNNFPSNIVIRRYHSSLLFDHSTSYSVQDSQKRFKSKKASKGPEYDSDSDEEDNGDGASKPVTVRVQSLRIDGLLKKGLGLARNKIETVFYEGGLRINGAKPTKKSQQVQIGDEVDLIKGVSPMNPDFLSISRIELLSVKEDPEEEGQLIAKIRRTKTLYIENYETHPWKKTGQ